MTRRFLLTLAVLWGLGLGTVAACPTRARVVVVDKVVVVRNKLIVAEVAPVAVFVPFAVAVPQYSVSYGAPPYQAPAYAPPQAPVDPCAARMAAMQKQIDDLKASLKAPKGGDPKSPVPDTKDEPPSDGPVVAAPPVFLAKCAACHDKAKASVQVPAARTTGKTRAKGGDFVLTDGKNLASLSSKQALKVTKRAYKGEMPPPDNGEKIEPLTDAEVAEIMSAKLTK